MKPTNPVIGKVSPDRSHAEYPAASSPGTVINNQSDIDNYYNHTKGDKAEKFQCPYPDVTDPTKPCSYTIPSATVAGVHKRDIHQKKDAKVTIKGKVKNNSKKSKRIDSKAVKFCENEEF